MTKQQSDEITEMIDHGDLSMKPGWVRMSFHPTNTDEEILFVCDAVVAVARNYKEWSKEYVKDIHHATFIHSSHNPMAHIELVKSWFNLKDAQ